ncbi:MULTISPECIES: hypothetical protein [Pseudoalteromonas]|uniref:hypothetical protein n=1 Tax=Pseudoalteromonas TaxID=53246 RepID=UPI0002319D74|nr:MULTISPECIES: hypothetical protein [Pseudoalteromonas]MBG9990745.1 hypothetical protein [Pseudoalteromonas sp. NZS37]MBH0033573.1 hypothetical protein [Pseudoalteromonas sp. NZS71_1]GAA68377.1 hypothetical protein P20429_2504 [Pseudoalteromonas sp. BSi20429]
MKSKVIEFDNSTNTIEVINLNFDVELLEITISIDGDKIDIIFEDPAGFRVLDEGDLLEFWPDCSLQAGWLHEINSDGWFDLEKNRNGFLLADNAKVTEYLVVGVNYCVSILAWEKPKVQQSTR